MGLAIMILGLVLFIGTHLVTTQRDMRAALIARSGRGRTRASYSIASIIGVLLIGWGFGLYRATGWIDVWYPPNWTRHVAALLVLIAIDLPRRGLFARPHQDRR